MLPTAVFSSRALGMVAASLALLSVVSAHMEMTSPPPRGSKLNKLWPPEKIDYSLTAPLSGPGAFPCQGKPAGQPVATFSAGSSIPVSIGGSAVHGGGHCEFSVQYPGQSKFVVLKRVLGTCLIDSKDYTVDLPASLPSCEGCAFAWSWINAVGNREYYMNCADINIKGKAGGSFTGDEMMVGNLAGLGPDFPEFGAGKADGREKYENRPQVTIGGGSSAPAPAPAAAPAAPAAPAPEVTIPEAATAPAPEAAPAAPVAEAPVAQAPASPAAAPEVAIPEASTAEASTAEAPTAEAPAAPEAPAADAQTPALQTDCTADERKCMVQGLMFCRRGRWTNTGLWCSYNQQAAA